MIAGLSGYLLIHPQPEFFAFADERRFATLEGSRGVTQTVLLEEQEPAGGSILLGPVYAFTSSEINARHPFVLSFDLGVAPFTIPEGKNLTLFHYLDGAMMWEAVASSEDPFTKILSAEITESGYYSLGLLLDIFAPTYIDTLNSLRALSPEGTVGYRVSQGYSLDGGPMITFGDPMIGGCDGTFDVGSRLERSMRSIETEILLNDLWQSAELSYVAEWFLDDKSCPTESLAEIKSP